MKLSITSNHLFSTCLQTPKFLKMSVVDKTDRTWRHISAFALSIVRFGYQRQLLTQEQQDQTYEKKRAFTFEGIDFHFADNASRCSEINFLCTRLNRGDNPITTKGLEFEFSGHPDDSAFTGCTRIRACTGNPCFLRHVLGDNVKAPNLPFQLKLGVNECHFGLPLS